MILTLRNRMSFKERWKHLNLWRSLCLNINMIKIVKINNNKNNMLMKAILIISKEIPIITNKIRNKKEIIIVIIKTRLQILNKTKKM